MDDAGAGGSIQHEAVEATPAEPDGLLVVQGGGDGFRARLVSTRALTQGTVVAGIERYSLMGTASYRSVQVAEDRHVEDIGVLAYLNHSCAPNVAIDVERMVVRALRPIVAGDELTFFYPSTEWDMAQPFQCWCGAAGCLGRVAGARHIPRDGLARHVVAPHVARLAGLPPFPSPSGRVRDKGSTGAGVDVLPLPDPPPLGEGG